MAEQPTPVEIRSVFDDELGLYTLSVVGRENHAILASKVVTAEEAERLEAEGARRGEEEVDPVAFIAEVLGPWTVHPVIVGCVHMDAPNALCGPCGR